MCLALCRHENDFVCDPTSIVMRPSRQISNDTTYEEGDIPQVLLYFVQQKFNCPSGCVIDVIQWLMQQTLYFTLSRRNLHLTPWDT